MRRTACAVTVLLAGCLRATTFHCASDGDCVRGGVPGRCEATSYCGFPDVGCPSGERYGDFSGTYTGQCVGAEMGDAGRMDARAIDALYDARVTVIDGPDPGMVAVSAGGFMMGCNAALDTSCDADESPYHLVTLSGYEIDVTEVTQSAYNACVTASACANPHSGMSCSFTPSTTPNLPVSCVDYAQAAAYCAWAGKRLPTEAEWEKAARGGDGRVYPWGNTTADCTYADLSGCGGLANVGSLAAGKSPYGLYDASGNVEEWVSDWYGSTYYSTSPSSNPTGPATGTQRVFRGGSYVNPVSYMRASNRRFDLPSNNASGLGFRCAR